MTWIMFGLKTCDTCRKARRWLDSQGVPYRAHDLREAPPTRNLLQQWLDAVGPERLVNRRSTTWRGLSEEARAAAAPGADPETLLALLAEQPTLIKRPVFQRRTEVLVGFDHAVRGALAGSSAPNQDSLRHA
ncbi:Spx/MgsR family RNA polymerase-binding regulatory protein [Marinibaculum pumilum]|uniref:Spx/MgsR family RNA polymerase-binding regulatory protein n=2 Tax=Marinibaculum pumilum TaxID=1766165 RepID=A0ABV7L745_9PROT